MIVRDNGETLTLEFNAGPEPTAEDRDYAHTQRYRTNRLSRARLWLFRTE